MTRATEARRPDGIALLLFAASFHQAADNHLVPPLLPEFERLLGAAAADFLVAAYALGAAVVPFVVAATFKGAAKKLTPYALAIHAAAAAAFAFSPHAAFRAISGAASGVLSFALLAHAAEAEDQKTRARRIAAQTAGFSTALVAGVPLGAFLADATGPRIPFFGAAGFGLLLSAIAFFATRGADPATRATSATPRASWRSLLFEPRALFGLSAVFLVGAAVAGPATRLGVRLHDDGGLSTTSIGLVYLVAGAAPLATLPIAGPLLRRLGSARLAALGSLLFTAPALAFAPASAAAFVPAAIVFFFAVACDVLRRTGLQALMAEAAPPPERARFLAVRGLIAQIGFAIGAAAAVPLHRGGGGFAAVCVVGAATSLVGAACAYAANPKLQGRPR